MARGTNQIRDPRSFRDVNLAPLVDVMLVLLFVFMVTAPLLTTGLPVELPHVSAEPAPVTDARFVVSITADEHVHYQGRDITGDASAAFEADPVLRSADTLYVRADENARYGVVAGVVAAARTAGVGAVSLVVEAEEP